VRHRIVLDTDMGSDVDDALCLALALASPEIELVAVTTVSGDTVRRARIARRLLELAGRGDVPVHAGLEKPRTEGSTFAWGGHEGEGILAKGDDPAVEAEPAAEAIARLLRSEDDLEIVAVGPMTNVAAVLDADPTLAGRIRRLTLMGGHVREIRYHDFVFAPGVDYNFCSDP
jgi:purine nucleosidase